MAAGSTPLGTPITRSVFGESLAQDAVLHLWAMEAYEKHKPIYPEMCNMRSFKGTGDRIITMEATGLGPMPEKAEFEHMITDGVVEGLKQTSVFTTRALAVHFSEETIEDSARQKSVMVANQLAQSARDAEEIDVADVVNSGTDATVFATSDGNAVFYATHSNLDGTTYSNLTAGYAAYTVLKSVLLAIRKRAGHRGAPIVLSVKNLWCPPDQEDKLDEVIMAHGLPNSTDNDAIAQSVASLRGKVRSNPWFTGTNACFIRCIEHADNQGISLWRKAEFRVSNEKDTTRGGRLWRARTRYAVTVGDPRTLQGFGYSAS